MASIAYLPMNEPATITIELSDLFMPSDGKIKDILSQEISTGAYIISVNRNLGTERFAITFKPRSSRTGPSWEQAFSFALEKHGYEPTVIALDAGVTSSAPGGLLAGVKDVLTEVTDVPIISETQSTLKWVAAGAIALAAIAYLPMFSGIGSSIKHGIKGGR
jgi:hypothetical protein